MMLRVELFPSDLDPTVDFYTRVLGFALVRDEHRTDVPYLAMQRGDVRIGAALRSSTDDPSKRRPPTGVEIVLEVDDLKSLHDHVVATGWPLTEGLQARPWGLRDFRLLDPSGYYLRLTEHQAHAPAG